MKLRFRTTDGLRFTWRASSRRIRARSRSESFGARAASAVGIGAGRCVALAVPAAAEAPTRTAATIHRRNWLWARAALPSRSERAQERAHAGRFTIEARPCVRGALPAPASTVSPLVTRKEEKDQPGG